MSVPNKLYGIVACGGASARMGTDKGMLIYHQKPQRYHVYNLLQSVSDRVFISCRASQAIEIEKEYEKLIDLECYENSGPMASLLTARSYCPQADFFVVGCDYPFITERDIQDFLGSIQREKFAAAFYNSKEELYEPLLAWYSASAANLLVQFQEEKKYSLQQFLKSLGARKYFPRDENIIKSIDTPESFAKAKASLAV